MSKFLISSCCVFCSHKCLVSLFFYSSSTVVCILISTIPRKWVRLGFNCLFLVLHVFFSVSPSVFYFVCSAICYRFELLCCSTKTLGLSDLDVQYLNLEKYFHQFFRCHGVMFDWLIGTAYCYGILFSCVFSSSNFNIIFFTRYVQIQFPILLGYLLPLMGICKFVCDFFQID